MRYQVRRRTVVQRIFVRADTDMSGTSGRACPPRHTRQVRKTWRNKHTEMNSRPSSPLDSSQRASHYIQMKKCPRRRALSVMSACVCQFSVGMGAYVCVCVCVDVRACTFACVLCVTRALCVYVVYMRACSAKLNSTLWIQCENILLTPHR